jgi:hypothetical protein
VGELEARSRDWVQEGFGGVVAKGETVARIVHGLRAIVSRVVVCAVVRLDRGERRDGWNHLHGLGRYLDAEGTAKDLTHQTGHSTIILETFPMPHYVMPALEM